LHRAQIDFHGTGGHPRDPDAISGQFSVVRSYGEPGASPVFARGRQITHGDEDSFDANYSHNLQTLKRGYRQLLQDATDRKSRRRAL
jgi:hypothetical protein